MKSRAISAQVTRSSIIGVLPQKVYSNLMVNVQPEN